MTTAKPKSSALTKIVAFLLIAVIPLSSGYMAGKTTNANNPVAVYIQNLFGIENETTSPNVNNPILNGESIIEMHPIPEITDDGYSAQTIYQNVTPSIVQITVYADSQISPIGSGTGIVLSNDGYIVTNAHVLEGGSSVNVEFLDGDQIRGSIVGADTDTDLAVIQVAKADLHPAEFGDSESVVVGDRAIVIGNPGGLAYTLTQGVISGLDRDINDGTRSLDLIQVDAAINPGNSGGPLYNRFGQVVGITSSKIADVDFEGIGFAIPISEAAPIIDSLIAHGYVAGRAVLGVSIYELNDTNGPPNGLPNAGVYIASIEPDSDLLNKGVRERDVITHANGVEIKTTDDLLNQLEAAAPGDLFNIEIYRVETDQTFSVDVVLSEAK